MPGAEAAGVRHARADLFEGATWYLTPGERTSGMHYDRLYRIISGLGARPTAITPETHDRLMATVSHLPHVLANVLVGQAARALLEEEQHLPATGPSFRDATRVAGSNPAVWRDIFVANRETIELELRGLRRGAGAADRTAARGRRLRGRALDRGRSRRPPAAAGAGAGGRPGQRAARLRPEPARHRGPDRARAGRGRGEHRRHGPVPGRRHAIRSDRALGRGRRERRARDGADRRARLPGRRGRERRRG